MTTLCGPSASRWLARSSKARRLSRPVRASVSAWSCEVSSAQHAHPGAQLIRQEGQLLGDALGRRGVGGAHDVHNAHRPAHHVHRHAGGADRPAGAAAQVGAGVEGVAVAVALGVAAAHGVAAARRDHAAAVAAAGRQLPAQVGLTAVGQQQLGVAALGHHRQRPGGQRQRLGLAVGQRHRLGELGVQPLVRALLGQRPIPIRQLGGQAQQPRLQAGEGALAPGGQRRGGPAGGERLGELQLPDEPGLDLPMAPQRQRRGARAGREEGQHAAQPDRARALDEVAHRVLLDERLGDLVVEQRVRLVQPVHHRGGGGQDRHRQDHHREVSQREQSCERW